MNFEIELSGKVRHIQSALKWSFIPSVYNASIKIRKKSMAENGLRNASLVGKLMLRFKKFKFKLKIMDKMTYIERSALS